MKMRKEMDILGELDVPENAYWGINTQRAIRNFQISGRTLPWDFIVALVNVKKACIHTNIELKEIPNELGNAMLQAIENILTDVKFRDQFPIDIFQTGSGTQTNMNVNEVIANRANEILGKPRGTKSPVHPNDHVNRGQSSNDVIPTAMHVAAAVALHTHLFPAVDRLKRALEAKIKEFDGITKIGRTHLQDAVPIPLSMEFDVYRTQFADDLEDLGRAADALLTVPIGGTALGTGLNAPIGFAKKVASKLSKITKLSFRLHPVKAEGIASHKAIVRLSAALRSLALSCLKMADDIRWMASGPRAGLGELKLPANEPGSSIMPGKINPTQSEALIQVCMQVIGNDTTVAASEGFGSRLDLNTTKPVMTANVLDSIHLLSNGISSFIDNCLEGIEPDLKAIQSQLDRSLMIVTKLSPVIGYDRAGEIAKQAYKSGKTIRETIKEMGIEIEDDLDKLLDPSTMV
ncbi:MAG: class II fumarate hydratase [Promethearchaeota archaeon]